MVCTHVRTLRMLTYSFPSLVDMLCLCQRYQKSLSLPALIRYLATHSIFSSKIYIFIIIPSYLSLPVYEMHPKRKNCFKVGTSPVTGGDVWLRIPLRNTAGVEKDGHTSSFYDHNDRFHGEQSLQIAWLDPLTFSNFRDAGQRQKQNQRTYCKALIRAKGVAANVPADIFDRCMKSSANDPSTRKPKPIKKPAPASKASSPANASSFFATLSHQEWIDHWEDPSPTLLDKELVKVRKAMQRL